MVTNGQQCFEGDWISSTSVNCGESNDTMATQIIKNLFKQTSAASKNETIYTNNENISSNNSNSSKQSSCESSRKASSNVLSEDKINESMNTKKQSYYFENFDESQHLNGCPVKWLYKKKLLEADKMIKVKRFYVKHSNNRDYRKDKTQQVWDRTPAEVKIYKINLTGKQESESNENICPSAAAHPFRKTETVEAIKVHKKKLARKLNRKLQNNDNLNESELETSSDLSSLCNYLPPRPLIGLKPLLSVLLLPNQANQCCTPEMHLKTNPRTENENESESPVLSINSLNFPDLSSDQKICPNSSNAKRWGSKSVRLQKKLQIPNQITINLRQSIKSEVCKTKKPHNQRHSSAVAKTSIRECYSRSLSNLFYELSDKANYRNIQNEYFEDLIRELTIEDEKFKIQKFLTCNDYGKNAWPGQRFRRLEERKSQKSEVKTLKIMKRESKKVEKPNFFCEKVSFCNKFERKGR